MSAKCTCMCTYVSILMSAKCTHFIFTKSKHAWKLRKIFPDWNTSDERAVVVRSRIKGIQSRIKDKRKVG